jgi:hypothetical protein
MQIETITTNVFGFWWLVFLVISEIQTSDIFVSKTRTLVAPETIIMSGRSKPDQTVVRRQQFSR